MIKTCRSRRFLMYANENPLTKHMLVMTYKYSKFFYKLFITKIYKCSHDLVPVPNVPLYLCQLIAYLFKYEP